MTADAQQPRQDDAANQFVFNAPIQSAVTNFGGTQNIYQQAPRPQIDPMVAQALLDALPDDVVPQAASLPTYSRMPLSANPNFVGREDDFKRLATTLKQGGTVAVVTTGIGGVGKTQLATEFVHRYGQFFAGGVYWLSFAEPGNVATEIAACGGPGALDLPGFTALAFDDQVRRVCQEWQGPLPRLLVFDTCEDEELLKQWRPTTGGCSVLVTSRRDRWSRALGVTPVPLGVLAREESIALLRKHRPDIAEADANAIGAELGDLPLALHLAGSYLETFADSARFGDPQQFLNDLRDVQLLGHPALQGRDATPSPTNHILHVGKTFALSLERLDPNNPVDEIALVLLAQAACMAPGEPIPSTLLLTAAPRLQADGEATMNAERALNRLRELGLLERVSDGALRLHQLLAAFVNQTIPEKQDVLAVHAAINNLATKLNDAGYPTALLPILPHLRHSAITAHQLMDDRAAALLGNLGFFYRSIGLYEDAQVYVEQALHIREQVLGSFHLGTASTLTLLGAICSARGDYGAARTYYERALQIRKQLLGSTDPATAASMNNLGTLLQTQGDYSTAREYLEKALQLNTEAFGATHLRTVANYNNLGNLLQEQGELAGARANFEQALFIQELNQQTHHRDTAITLNNLGTVVQIQGDLGSARQYYERALCIQEQVLGANHPDIALTLNNIAAVAQAQADWATARHYYERALHLREQAFGEEHPVIVLSLNNLGSVLQSQGDLDLAQIYYERALNVHLHVFSENHPGTAMLLNNLGSIFSERGQYENALQYYEHALRINEQCFGPEHFDTARVLNNVSNMLVELGRFVQARPYAERALHINQQVFGLEHASTAASFNTLGRLLQALGDLPSARPLLEQALQINRQVLGECHPDTARSFNNLGSLLQSQGQLEAARPHLEQALRIREQVLGETHPDTANSLNNLGGLLQTQGDFEGARACFERALRINEQVFGLNHPDTATSLQNLAVLYAYQDRFQQAIPLMERALAIRKQVFGVQHPNTQWAQQNLENIRREAELAGLQLNPSSQQLITPEDRYNPFVCIDLVQRAAQVSDDVWIEIILPLLHDRPRPTLRRIKQTVQQEVGHLPLFMTTAWVDKAYAQIQREGEASMLGELLAQLRQSLTKDA
jgi:tetratricopeptide (TPR) repeat protein